MKRTSLLDCTLRDGDFLNDWNFGYIITNSIFRRLATYKRKDYAINLMKYFEFDKYFDSICGADNKNKFYWCYICFWVYNKRRCFKI